MAFPTQYAASVVIVCKLKLCLLVGRASVLVPLIVDEGWFALMQA